MCQIYGIDVAFGAVVMAALNIWPGDHVLDLCVAPGKYFFLYPPMLVFSIFLLLKNKWVRLRLLYFRNKTYKMAMFQWWFFIFFYFLQDVVFFSWKNSFELNLLAFSVIPSGFCSDYKSCNWSLCCCRNGLVWNVMLQI